MEWTTLREELFWVLTRISPLILIHLFVETAYNLGWMAFLGTKTAQAYFHDIILKIILTLYAWFIFAFFKKYLIPAIKKASRPILEKFVKEPSARIKATESLEAYMTYAGYIVFFIVLASIWAYSAVGKWLLSFLGTSVALILTFILGLFTSSILGNVIAYWILENVKEFKVGDRVKIGEVYGDVIELNPFFTRVRTIKNEVVSIPNLVVMNKEVKNYSTLKTPIVHVQVTLGYEVDKEIAKTY